MDDAEAANDEFGTATMSAPLFTVPDERFKFALGNVTASTFYNDAKTNVQGRVADAAQRATVVGAAANVSVDPTQAAAYLAALGQYQQASALNAQAQSLATQKQSLLNNAALQQYYATLAQAQQATTPDAKNALLSQAQSQFSAAFGAPGPTTMPAFPTASTPTAAPTSLAQSGADAAGLLNGSTLGVPGSLLSGGTTLSDRDAIFQAAGDNATAAIFSALGDPTAAQKFADKQVLMGVVTVAVNPGWRSRRGYGVEIAAQSQFTDRDARLAVVAAFLNDPRVGLSIRKRVAMDYGLELPSGTGDPLSTNGPIPAEYHRFTVDQLYNISPIAIAVSPLTQSDVEQDANSRRQQTQVALDLAAAFATAGAQAQANFFLHYAERLEQDVATSNPRVVVNTWSNTGGLFGFDIGPRLTAVENPAAQTSAPGLVLERQAFPAMIMFGFEADDIRPRVAFDEAGRLRVYEVEVKLTTAANWHPLSAWAPRVTEQDRLARFQHLMAGTKALREAQAADALARDEDRARDLLESLAYAPAADDGTDDLFAALERVIDDDGKNLAHRKRWQYEHLVRPVRALRGAAGRSRDTGKLYLAEAAQQMDQLAAQEAATPTPAKRTAEVPGAAKAVAAALPAKPVVDDDKALAEAYWARSLIVAAATSLELDDWSNARDQLRKAKDALDGLSDEVASHVAQRKLESAADADAKTTPAPKPTGLLARLRARVQQILDGAAADKGTGSTTDKQPAKPQAKDPLTFVSRARELCVAAQVLARRADDEAQRYARARQTLVAQATGMYADLFPEDRSSVVKSDSAFLHLPQRVFNGPADQPIRPQVDVEELAYSRFREVSFNAYGAIYTAPLPLQTIVPASKATTVADLASDFMPTLHTRVATQPVTVLVHGSNLDAIDLTGTVKVLTVPTRSGAASDGMVTLVGTPTYADNVIRLQVSVSPRYDEAFALQLPLKADVAAAAAAADPGAPASIVTPPIRIARLDEDDAPKEPAIRRVTGPIDDPSRQQVDEEQFYNLPPAAVRDQIESQRHEDRHRIDVNVDLNRTHDTAPSGG